MLEWTRELKLVGIALVYSTNLEWYPLRWLGKVSYGLYLWHWLLLKTVSLYYWVGYWDPWARFLLALGVSALSFYVVERPFNKLKARFLHSTNTSRLQPEGAGMGARAASTGFGSATDGTNTIALIGELADH